MLSLQLCSYSKGDAMPKRKIHVEQINERQYTVETEWADEFEFEVVDTLPEARKLAKHNLRHGALTAVISGDIEGYW